MTDAEIVSDTPRTDEAEFMTDSFDGNFTEIAVTESSFARQLERELASALEELARLKAPVEVAGMVKECRAISIHSSNADKIVANAKSARNQAAGDEGAHYSWLTPEQTLEGRCAAALESLAAQVAEAKKERQRLVDANEHWHIRVGQLWSDKQNLRDSLGSAEAQLAERDAELAALKGRLHEIAEEWAGAECGEPVTAQEAYAIGLCKRMYQLAAYPKG